MIKIFEIMKRTYIVQNYTAQVLTLIVLFFTISIGNTWGTVTSPIILTTNGSTLGYSTGTVTLTDKFDYKLTFSSVTGGSSDGYIQNAKSSDIYNTVAIPGAITSIKLTDCATTSAKTDGGFSIYGGTTLANCTTLVGSATGLSNAAEDKTINFTESDNYTFFKITNGSERVLKISSIVISFSTGGGSGFDLTFTVPSGVTQPDTQKSSVALPTPSGSPTNCGDCWAFAGWTTSTNSTYSGSSAPTPLYAAGSTQSFASDATLYAVYKKEEYKAIKSTSGLVPNDYYVIVSQTSSIRQALSNTAHSYYDDTDAAAADVSSYAHEDADGYYLYNVPSNVIWKFTGSSSTGQLQNMGNTSIYLNLSSQATSILNSTNDLTFAVSGFEWTISSTYYLGGYSTDSHGYGYDAASSDDFADSRYHPYIYHRTSASYATSPGCSSYDIVWMKDGSAYDTGSPTETTNICEGIETLPTPPADNTISSCANVFMGWSETSSSKGGLEPEDLFIHASDAPRINEDKTFYAVFASMDSLSPTKTQTLLYDTWEYDGTTTDRTTYRLFGNNSYIVSDELDLRTLAKVIVYGGTFGGDDYNSISIGDGTNIWKNVTVSGNKETGVNEYTGGSALRGKGYLHIKSNSGNGTSNGVRISKVEIYTYPVESYRTSCCTEHNISLVSVTGGTIEADPTSACEGAAVTLAATPSTGYTFTEWTVYKDDDDSDVTSDVIADGDEDESYVEMTMPDYDVTVDATFTAKEYSIVLDKNGGTSDGEATATYNSSSLSSVTHASYTGYTLLGYYTETSGGDMVITANGALVASVGEYTDANAKWIYDDDAVFAAQWKPNGTWNVTITAPSNGTITVTYNSGASSMTSGSAYIGGTVTITATGSTGYELATDGLKVNGTTFTSGNSLTLSEDITISATFSLKKHNVAVTELSTVTISAGDIDAGENADVDYGTELTLSYTDVTSGHYWSDWKVTNTGGDDVTEDVVSGSTLTVPDYDIIVTARIYGDVKAWCIPTFNVTGDVHLTSTAGVYVNLTKDADNLINFSGSDLSSVSKITIDYLDENGDVVETKSSSPLRLYGSAGTSLAEGNITSASITSGAYNQDYSIRLTVPAATYNTEYNYKLQLKIYKGTRVIKTVEHPMNGRALPEEFVIAVKKGDDWVALPSDLASTSAQPSIVPQVITVDNTTTPTTAIDATCIYKATGRNAVTKYMNGIRFTTTTPSTNWLQTAKGDDTYNMWLSTTNSDSAQVWYLSSSDFGAYTLKMDSKHNGSKKMGIYSSTYMGFHGSPNNANIYLLPIKFTVTYDNNGSTSGSVPTDANKYDHNDEVTVLGNTGSLEKTGCTFDGWNTQEDGEGTTYVADATFDMPAEPVTLYAKWSGNDYTLTLNDAFGSSVFKKAASVDEISVTYGSNTGLTSTITPPQREGYIFGGYYTEEDGAGSQLIDKDGNVIASVTGYTDGDKKWIYADDQTVYAKWTDDHIYYFTRPGERCLECDKNWTNENNWTKRALPGRTDTAILLDLAEIHNTTVAIAEVRMARPFAGWDSIRPVNSPNKAYYPNGYVDIFYDAALLVTDSIRNYDIKNKKYHPTSTGTIWIWASDALDGTAGRSGVLITKKEHIGNEAMVQYSTAACKKTYTYYDEEKDEWVYDKVDYVNQYFGIPFVETNVSSYYGVYMYKYLAESNSFQSYTYQTMDAFTAYMLLSANPGYGTNFEMRGILPLPGISSEATDTTLLLARRAADVAESKPTTNMFANSWMGPMDITAFDASDFVNCEASFYLFNAGSKTDSLINAQAGNKNMAGQWTTLSVSAVKADDKLQQVIPPMQSFLLVTDADKDAEQTYSLTLDYKKHVYDPAMARINRGENIPIIPVRAPRRTNDDNAPEIMRLFVEGETGTGDHVYIYMRDDFTQGFDNTWDGRKITGSSYAPQLYAQTNAGKMALNAVDDVEGTVIGFRKSAQESSFTITFEYEGSDVWYLNDLKEEKSTQIDSENSYTFLSSANDNANRFVISAVPLNSPTITTGTGGVSDGARVRKLMIDGILYIIREGRVYDVTGTLVK